MHNRPIVITGFMGSGKTSVARALAHLLHCTAIDLDAEITSTEEHTPAELIIQNGEAAFREIETRALQRVLVQGTRVIALGGGAWTVSNNRELIAGFKCFTVWLDAPFEACWKRIASSGGNRPLAPDRQRAERLYELRRPVYELAKMRIEVTEELAAHDLAERVAAQLLSVDND